MATAIKSAKKAQSKKQAAQTVAEKFRHAYALIGQLGTVTEAEFKVLRDILDSALDTQGTLEKRIAALEKAAKQPRKRWWQRTLVTTSGTVHAGGER